MIDRAIDFIRGATMMAELGIAIAFLRYHRKYDDKLFGFFSASFAVMAVSQAIIFIFGDKGEHSPIAYYLRLFAFLLLVIGIAVKNIRTRPDRDKDEAS